MLKLTGGTHGGRPLKWSELSGIRPTPARVREALFNIFRDEVPGSTWWDLCCGSGVVGLEALSRGAKQVCFVDQHRRALHYLRENLALLEHQDQAQVRGSDLLRFLKREAQISATFIYCDPPYDSSIYQPVLEILGQMPLAENCPQVTLILEYRKCHQHWRPTAPWQVLNQRQYGDTCLAILQRTT